MTDRRRRRPKVVPRAAADFVWQLKIIAIFCSGNLEEGTSNMFQGTILVVKNVQIIQNCPFFGLKNGQMDTFTMDLLVVFTYCTLTINHKWKGRVLHMEDLWILVT